MYCALDNTTDKDKVPTLSLEKRSPSSSKASKPSIPSSNMKLVSTNLSLGESGSPSSVGMELNVTTMLWSWICWDPA